MKEWFDRLAKIRVKHREQRLDLEVELESLYLEPTMSPRLNDMLAREQEAGQAEHRRRIASTVDGMMRREMQEFAHREQEHKLSRRRELMETQTAELRALAAEARRRIPDASLARRIAAALEGSDRSSAASASAAASPTGDADSRGFAGQERAMRVAARRGFADSEAFNVRTAFDTQRARVREEWGGFVDRMTREFEAEAERATGHPVSFAPVRAAVEASLGLVPTELPAAGAAGSSPSRWVDKEKQSQLVHTAPVLSPTMQSPQRRSGGSGRRVTGAAGRRLKQLRREFAAGMKDVYFQREESLRWIARQEIRMLDEVAATAPGLEEAQQRADELEERVARAVAALGGGTAVAAAAALP